MYADRIRTLMRAYKSAERSNKAYVEARDLALKYQNQISFLAGLDVQIRALDAAITQRESEWRDTVLSVLETEIMRDLAYVYPTDGYRVKLATKILRGKIHIDASVYSFNSQQLPGRISATQGRLFQQVVSFAALVGVMTLLGIKTIYVDEAFSGSSKRNIRKLNRLLSSLQERGYNIIMIAQDTTVADGIPANVLYLTRSIDNKTTIVREVNRNGSQS